MNRSVAREPDSPAAAPIASSWDDSGLDPLERSRSAAMTNEIADEVGGPEEDQDPALEVRELEVHRQEKQQDSESNHAHQRNRK